MRKRWWFIGGAAVVVALGVSSLFLMGGNAPAGIPVATAAVTQADLQNEVLTSGQAKVKEEITLFANSSGILHALSVKEGDTVRKGQLIGKIDIADVEGKIMELEAQIELQKANLAKAQAGAEPEEIAQLLEKVKQEARSLQTSQKELTRIQQLYASGAVTAQELEKAKDALALAESNLNVAKQNLALKQKGPRKEELQSIQAQINQLLVEKAQREKERKESVLVAPADGTVLSVDAKNGQHVSEGTEVLTLGDLQQIIVEANVNESDVHKIALGQEAIISGSSIGDSTVKAKVASIAPIAVTIQSSSGQGEQTRVKVTLELLEPAPILKPGYHVDINIITQRIAHALQVPMEAVQQEPDGTPFLWVLENGHAKKRKVRIGIENELFTQIISGVSVGQEIITNPPEFLKENDAVVKSTAPLMPSGF